MGRGWYFVIAIALALALLLVPSANLILATRNARTIAQAAFLEIGLVSLAAGILAGLRLKRAVEDPMEGAATWLAVALIGLPAIYFSFNIAAYGLGSFLSKPSILPGLPGFSLLPALLISCASYQAAFFVARFFRSQSTRKGPPV